MDPFNKQWTLFLQRCLQKRVRADQFGTLALKLTVKSPIPGARVAEIILDPTIHQSNCLDPLLPVYVERLLAIKLVDASDVLNALFKGSRDHHQQPNGNAAPDQRLIPTSHNPPELEETLLHRLAKAHASRERPKTPVEARRTLHVMSQWMSAMVTSSTSESMMDAMTGNISQVQPQTLMVREALAMLMMALFESPKVVGVLDTAFPKKLRKDLAQALSLFIPFLSQTSLQVSNRLEAFQKQHALTDHVLSADGQENGIDVAALQLEAVIDLPTIHTRAGLYIFVNSLLFARPLTDDMMILNYLHSRYKGDIQSDIQSLSTDLVVASFDALANTMYRGEPNDTLFAFKSFLVNKVPMLLVTLSVNMFPPLTPEFCITQALLHVDPNAFPSFSQTFGMSGNTALSDVRQEFLFACTAHGLIQEQSIERLLGEQPMSTPPKAGSRYVKENLIMQCSANTGKVEQLLNELENLDGNAGAIVGAVTEVIRNLCTSRETSALKAICNALSRKPQSLDVVLQFTSPASVLQPLCNLLDTWRYDEDQGEYQPVYDEFAAILLLTLAFIYRYDLTYHDISISHSSFVAQLLERGHISLTPDELSEDQSKHLSAWLRGLFDSESMSDETMSSCRPQEFYLLVPTLFSQTIQALSADVLGSEAVKNGLEYLLETFLIPSLLGAITWMINHAWAQTHEDSAVLLDVLFKLIVPASISGDAQAMHGTILSIVSRRLDKCLRLLQRRNPSRHDIEPFIEVLKPHLTYERTAYSNTNELMTWTCAPNNMRQSIRTSIQSLVMWSSAAAINVTQASPSYTHRQIFSLVKLFGARKVLRAIIDAVKSQTEAGSGALALDVATALICAPSSENSSVAVEWLSSPASAPIRPSTRQNLRAMLKLEHDEAAELMKIDIFAAETVVRLHRRVEAQLAAAQTQMPMNDLTASVANMDMLQPLDISGADAAAAAAAVENMDQALNLAGEGLAGDASGLGLAVDTAAAAAAAAASMDLGGREGGIDAVLQSADDDIFGGLMLDTEMADMEF